MGKGAGFGVWDWIVLVVYFVGCTAFGLWVSRKVGTSGGYFLGERKLPWWIMIGQAFGTGTHAENPVGQTGATFHYGFATIWFQWKNMFATPFYWLMAPWYRRSERTTLAEIIGDRYGPALALTYTIYAFSSFVFSQGIMLKGAGKIIAVATGGNSISPDGVVAVMTVAFLLYSYFGGLVAAAYTDFIQGFLIIALSFMLIPTGLAAVGGFASMRETLGGPSVAAYAREVEAQYQAAGGQGAQKPPIIPGDGKDTSGFFDVYNEASGIGAFTLLMLTLNGLVGITAQPHMVTMNATGRTERAGRIGNTYGTMVKRICTVGWAFTGLIVAALVVQQRACLHDREDAFGYACLRLLGPGWVGLMVSCVVAANMSACSNLMVNAGATFSRNIYKEYLNPAASDKALLMAGRLSGLASTLASVAFALLVVDQVLQAFLFNETIAALFGVIVVGGLLWRRANRYGAAAAIFAAFAIYYGLNYYAAGQWQQALDQMFNHWQAGIFGWAMLGGFASLIVVSLLTKAEDPRRIEQFFDNMRRSTDAEGLPDGQAKPLAAERGQDLLLLDLPGWFTARRWQGFFRRYREDLVGFLLAWGVVALLVLAAWGLMQVGSI
jgi:Na+/proline symporter